jgi:hypothetical protein
MWRSEVSASEPGLDVTILKMSREDPTVSTWCHLSKSKAGLRGCRGIVRPLFFLWDSQETS